jgi:hypothetical protein
MPLTIIPPAILAGLERYVRLGVRPGSCLYAILSGNLFEAFARSDPETEQAMPAIARYIREHVPGHLWGSPEVVSRYIAECAAELEGTERKQ